MVVVFDSKRWKSLNAKLQGVNDPDTRSSRVWTKILPEPKYFRSWSTTITESQLMHKDEINK